MHIAVIIPTKNRVDDLLRAVVSVLAQERRPDKLVVIDQSADDAGRKLVKELVAKDAAPGFLKYVHDTSIEGLVVAKDVGVRMCEGDIVCFLEDDIILRPRYFERVEQLFVENERIVGGCGVVADVAVYGVLYRVIFKLLHRGVFSDKRVDVHSRGNCSGRGELVQSKFLSGGLSFFRREVFDVIPFDTVNGFFALEDIDFSTRVAEHYGADRLCIHTGICLEHHMSPQNRAGLGLRWRRKTREFITFYKKRKHEPWSLTCLVWLLMGLFVSTLVLSVRWRSPAAMTGMVNGMIDGIRKRVVVVQKTARPARVDNTIDAHMIDP